MELSIMEVSNMEGIDFESVGKWSYQTWKQTVRERRKMELSNMEGTGFESVGKWRY